MATVGPDVLWEFHPPGLRITNRDTVREMYRLLIEHFFPYTTSGATERTRIYGDNRMVVELVAHLNVDGQASDAGLMSVISFIDGYVTSERVYVSGAMARLVENAFAGAFRDMPGVVDLVHLSRA